MSQSECVLSFERYEKRITKNMRGIVQGRREGDDVVTINTSVRYSVSDLLRRGYVKKPVDEAWLKEVICQSRVNTNTDRLDKAGGVEANAWHAMSKKYWITINDVLRMPPGKPIKLLALDRNVWDTVSTVNKRGVLYTPAHFFRLNTVIYWRSPDGGGISIYLEILILFSKSAGLLCLWMAVSGTAAPSIPQNLDPMSHSGRRN